MRIQVECYAGYRGEETPRLLRFGGRTVEVAVVLDRWLAPDHRYFKVTDGTGATYIVRQEMSTGTWDLVSFIAAHREPAVSLRGRSLGGRH